MLPSTTLYGFVPLMIIIVNKQRCVEQDALMSPNPSGKLEDPVDVCVLFSSLKLVNSLHKMI